MLAVPVVVMSYSGHGQGNWSEVEGQVEADCDGGQGYRYGRGHDAGQASSQQGAGYGGDYQEGHYHQVAYGFEGRYCGQSDQKGQKIFEEAHWDARGWATSAS